VGTISNIMQTINASQQRQVARESRHKSERTLLTEEHFVRMLWAEKKRSERFSKHMILMEVTYGSGNSDCAHSLRRLGTLLCSAIRETDVAGWIESNSALGVIFTELGDCSDIALAQRVIRERIVAFLETGISPTDEDNLQISFRSFCDDWAQTNASGSNVSGLVSNPKPKILPRKIIVGGYSKLVRRPVVDSGSSVA
jgi:hypothetical protein